MLDTQVGVKKRKDAADATERAHREYMLDIATVGFEESQEIISDEAIDTGQLLKSGFPPEVLRDGTVRFGYTAPYADDVEEGQPPHWPDIQPLKRWAHRVLGSEQLAYPVAKKISEEGTEAVRYMDRSVTKMKDWAASRDLNKYLIRQLD